MRARQGNQQEAVGEMRFMFGMYLAGVVGAIVAFGVAKLVYDKVRQSWSDDTVPSIVAVFASAAAFSAITACSMYGGGVTMRRLGMSGSLFSCCHKNNAGGAAAPVVSTTEAEAKLEPGTYVNPLAHT